MPAIKLNEVFVTSEVATTMKTEFNQFFTSTDKHLLDTEATRIATIISRRLTFLLPCDTIYPDVVTGKATIATYIQSHTLELVQELRNMLKSFDNEVSVRHNTTNFNPMDNAHIDDMPIETDNKSYTIAENMLGHIDFLINNSLVLDHLYKTIRRDCITII